MSFTEQEKVYWREFKKYANITYLQSKQSDKDYQAILSPYYSEIQTLLSTEVEFLSEEDLRTLMKNHLNWYVIPIMELEKNRALELAASKTAIANSLESKITQATNYASS